jgi:hypothetical protein
MDNTYYIISNDFERRFVVQRTSLDGYGTPGQKQQSAPTSIYLGLNWELQQNALYIYGLAYLMFYIGFFFRPSFFISVQGSIRY